MEDLDLKASTPKGTKQHPGLNLKGNVLTITFDFASSTLAKTNATNNAIHSLVHNSSEQTRALKIHLIFPLPNKDGHNKPTLRDYRIKIIKGPIDVINKRFYKIESVDVLVTMPAFNHMQFSTVVGCYYTTFEHWTLKYQDGLGPITDVLVKADLERQTHAIYRQHRATRTAIKKNLEKKPQTKPQSGAGSTQGLITSALANNHKAQAAAATNHSSVAAVATKAENAALSNKAVAVHSGGSAIKPLVSSATMLLSDNFSSIQPTTTNGFLGGVTQSRIRPSILDAASYRRYRV